MVPSELSNTSSTVAWLTGLRVEEPEKITSVRLSPRRRLAELSPMTQRTASMMLDLPQPFGPTTPVMLVGRCNVVGSTNDLKPESLTVVSRMECLLAARGAALEHGLGTWLAAGERCRYPAAPRKLLIPLRRIQETES